MIEEHRILMLTQATLAELHKQLMALWVLVGVIQLRHSEIEEENLIFLIYTSIIIRVIRY